MPSSRSSRPSIVLGLAFGGVLVGHTVAYRLLIPDAHGPRRVPSRDRGAAPPRPDGIAPGPRSPVVRGRCVTRGRASRAAGPRTNGRSTSMRRVLVISALAGALVLLIAGPALAHGL